MEQPYLDINNAAGRRQLVLRDEPITIGRHADNKLVLNDHMASRFHCVIERRGLQFVLRDLGASNGTRVNGQLVRTAALAPGDVVTVGQTQLVLVLPGDGGGAAAYTEPTTVDDEAIEELTEDDVVDDLEVVDDDAPIHIEHDETEDLAALAEGPSTELLAAGMPAMRVQAGVDDYESRLWSMTEAQPDRYFGEAEIAILDARGTGAASGRQDSRRDGPPAARRPASACCLLCFRSRATDIHVEPRESSFHCRIRVDGVMVDVCDFPAQMGQRISGVVKVLCQIGHRPAETSCRKATSPRRLRAAAGRSDALTTASALHQRSTGQKAGHSSARSVDRTVEAFRPASAGRS